LLPFNDPVVISVDGVVEDAGGSGDFSADMIAFVLLPACEAFSLVGESVSAATDVVVFPVADDNSPDGCIGAADIPSLAVSALLEGVPAPPEGPLASVGDTAGFPATPPEPVSLPDAIIGPCFGPACIFANNKRGQVRFIFHARIAGK
jgi:hypothetical protein